MNERDLFLSALDIPDPAARRAYLDQACAGQPTLRVAVEALLREHDPSGSFLDQPALDQMAAKRPLPDTDRLPPSAADAPPAAPSGSVDFPTQSFSRLDPDGRLDALLVPSDAPGSLGRLGHYEIQQLLGSGGFGTVVRAFDAKLHRTVAIKLMSPELAATSPARKRFLREAQSAAAIRHENVVQIYSVEESPVPFIVMEFIPGQTLDQKLQNSGPLAVADVLRIGQQIASGLAAAHALNLIHRDIKPANILLETGPREQVKITDFGLARAVDDASLTQSGMVAGTPMYMAPEQAHGQALDQRADLFSLGSVLYQMTSGRPPFRAASTLAVLKRVTEDTPRPILEIIPETPLWLCAIIAKLHAKDRADRIQTAQELSDLLTHCRESLAQGTEPQLPWPIPAELRALSPTASSLTPVPSKASPPRAARPASRSRTGLWAVLGVIATLLCGVILYQQFGPGTTPARITVPDGGSIEITSQDGPQTPSAPAGWQGWLADAPKPAIAPFNAAQAQQHQEEWAAYLKVPVEWENSIGMKFRLIPPGEFMMGSTPEEVDAALHDFDANWHEHVKSEAPRHRVILTRPIYLGVHEVTQAQFETVIATNPSHFSVNGAGQEAVAGLKTADHPVEMVSWNDAAEFCTKLSRREEFRPFYFRADETITPLDGTGYRLPTEAEWEWACRAGTTTKHWIGDQSTDLVQGDWFQTNSANRTHAVGELRANPFGLFDIHGNVWEWAQDGWDATSNRQSQDLLAINPEKPFTATLDRVLRGGGYWYNAAVCRSSSRVPRDMKQHHEHIGFRASLPVDTVRHALKTTGPAIPKPIATTPAAPARWHGWPADAPKPAIAPFNAEQAKQHQQEWAAYLKVPVEWENSVQMKFRLIPPGEFLMGSPAAELEESIESAKQSQFIVDWIRSGGPQHAVTLTQPFYLGVHEVSQGEFQTVVGTTPFHFAAGGGGAEKVEGLDTADFPVDFATWLDAAEFCEKLATREKMQPCYKRNGQTAQRLTGNGYRLPTDAQWEFAARAGTLTRFWTGETKHDLAQTGWFSENSEFRTHARGELSANPFGLYDMYGNVCEYVQDWWDPDYFAQFVERKAVDPQGPSSKSGEVVLRGGSWMSFHLYMDRSANSLSGATNSSGFRVALPIETVRQAVAATSPGPTSEPKSAARVAIDLTPPAPLGKWEMGPEPPWFKSEQYSHRKSEVLPGLIERPAKLPGIKRWNVDTVWSRGIVNVARWSPDGKWIATGATDGHVRIYESATMQLHRLLPGSGGGGWGVGDVAWHPDGDRLAAASESSAMFRIWSLAGDVLFEESVECRAVAWSKDGARIASGGAHAVQVRRGDGTVTKTLVAGLAAGCDAGSLTWSPDDERLACRHVNGSVRIWSPGTGDSELLKDAIPPKSYSLAWGSKGWIALADGQNLNLFDSDRKLMHTVPYLGGAVAWHPDGEKVYFADNYAVKAWDCQREEQVGITSEAQPGIRARPTALACSPDGSRVLMGGGLLRIHNADLTKVVFVTAQSGAEGPDLAWSPDGKRLASADGLLDHGVRLWSSEGSTTGAFSQRELAERWGYGINWVQWSPLGNALIGVNDSSGAWLSDDSGGLRRVLAVGSHSAAWNAAGSHFAVGTVDGKVVILNAAGEPIAEMTVGTGGTTVAWSRTTNLLLAHCGRQLSVCDPTVAWTFQPFAEATVDSNYDPPVWSPDGELISVPGGGWYGRDGKQVADTARPHAYDWRSDGKQYISSPLWKHLPNGTLLGVRASNQAIRARRWHPRGHLIAASGNQGGITAWDASNLQPYWHAVLLPEQKSATFSAAGELLDGEPEVVEKYLVYYVERDDGRIETLKPSEFNRLVSAGP